MQSANGRDTPVARIASATAFATPTASAGTRIDMTRSACMVISSSDGTSPKPALAARSLVRWLLPARHVMTRYPPSTSTFPTPWPMSPGLRIAIVVSPIVRLLAAGWSWSEGVRIIEWAYPSGNRAPGNAALRATRAGGAFPPKNRFKVFHSALFRMWGLGRLGRISERLWATNGRQKWWVERLWDTAPSACWAAQAGWLFARVRIGGHCSTCVR